MRRNTSWFWFMVTVVLATVYLVSNPTMARKLGARATALYQKVISSYVEEEDTRLPTQVDTVDEAVEVILQTLKEFRSRESDGAPQGES